MRNKKMAIETNVEEEDMRQRKRKVGQRMFRQLWAVLCLVLCAGTIGLFSPLQACAEDFIVDTPYQKEVEGSIYGRIYIAYPEQEVPIYPPEGSEGTGNSMQQTGARTAGLSYQSAGGYGYLSARASGRLLYRIHPDGDAVTVYGEAFEQALEKGEGLRLLIYDKEGTLKYRLRYSLEDLEAYREKQEKSGKDVHFEMEEIRFYDECSHEKQLEHLLGETESVCLYLCQNEDPQIPVYVGVRAPDGWEEEDPLKCYEYEETGAELKLSAEHLYMDEDRIIERRVEEMKDLVYTREAIQVQKVTAKGFAAGISGKNHQVNRWYLAGAGLLVIAGAGIFVRVFRGRKKE